MGFYYIESCLLQFRSFVWAVIAWNLSCVTLTTFLVVFLLAAVRPPFVWLFCLPVVNPGCFMSTGTTSLSSSGELVAVDKQRHHVRKLKLLNAINYNLFLDWLYSKGSQVKETGKIAKSHRDSNPGAPCTLDMCSTTTFSPKQFCSRLVWMFNTMLYAWCRLSGAFGRCCELLTYITWHIHMTHTHDSYYVPS